MYFEAETLDDLMMRIFPHLLKSHIHITASKGDTYEIPGVLLKLSNPLARLSRAEGKGTIFSCLGELLWYLSGTNKLDFIKYYLSKYDLYSDDQETIYGAYGPRLFGRNQPNQVSNIIKILSAKKTSRQAVIQLFSSDDILERHEDTPCTCTLQFLVRDSKLMLYTSMRSNDAYKGLPHDVFSFTMLQELIARELNLGLGEYGHYVSSLHIYTSDIDNINQYLKEAWQDHVQMPSMPAGSQKKNILKTLKCERLIRTGHSVNPNEYLTDSYWQDIVNLLKLYQASKLGKGIQQLEEIAADIKDEIYAPYIAKRLKSITSAR